VQKSENQRLKIHTDEKSQRQKLTHDYGIGFSTTQEDAAYLIYVLFGIDTILLTVIISFLWKKRHVFATREWGEVLEP